MESVLNWSVIISIIGVLVVLTNIVVQVLKIKGIAVVWYMVFAAVVLAFMVAYAAMFGFDKLKEALAQIHK